MDSKDLTTLDDDELVERFRKAKAEATGGDPGLTPPDDAGPIREEMERRGIAPDREDVVPERDSAESDPVADDRA